MFNGNNMKFVKQKKKYEESNSNQKEMRFY